MSTTAPLALGMCKLAADTAKRALEAALPNPWLVRYSEDVPELIAEIERLQGENRQLKEALRVYG